MLADRALRNQEPIIGQVLSGFSPPTQPAPTKPSEGGTEPDPFKWSHPSIDSVACSCASRTRSPVKLRRSGSINID
jgi:hypothetical protein